MASWGGEKQPANNAEAAHTLNVAAKRNEIPRLVTNLILYIYSIDKEEEINKLCNKEAFRFPLNKTGKEKKMATSVPCHARSISLPSNLHPSQTQFDEHLS